MRKIITWFENRIDPYPDEPMKLPTKGIIPFLWACLSGLRGWLVALIFFNVGMGVFEALLFDIMGKIVTWLGEYSPSELFHAKGADFGWIITLLLVSPLWLWILNSIRFQTLQGVFPMRLRWNFHRLMLNQSLSFYQDEFAGRVSAKVMQTALAVRDTIMTTCDMLVYVGVYFLSAGVILFTFDAWLLLPFVLWCVLFALMMRFLSLVLLKPPANKPMPAL